jgi:HEAT repeat protein
MDDHNRGRTPRLSLACCIAIAAALAGCGTYIGTTAKSFLRTARETQDPNLRYQAYSRLGARDVYTSPEDRVEAVKVLTAALEPGREPTASRIVICRTLASLNDHNALPALRVAAEDEDAMVRTEAIRAIGALKHPDDTNLLARVMTTDTSRDCRVAAIEALASIKTADPRIPAKLVEGMENEDPSVRLASYEALVTITGTDLGTDVRAWRARYAPAGPGDPAVAPAANVPR